MSLFAKRPTPSDCIERVSNAMTEVEAMRNLLDATPKGRDYKADWDANRKYAHAHLFEAWCSLGAALAGLGLDQHQPTRQEQFDATVVMQRGHLVALRADVKRLEAALALAEARTAAAEALAVQSAGQRQGNEIALRLRRAVISAVHPDKAADAGEAEWRTRLCQTLFPEIDRVMNAA